MISGEAKEAADAGRVWGELWIDEEGEANFLCHTSDEDFEATRQAILQFIAKLEWQIANEQRCPLHRK